jgi:hypothetical protein
MFLFSLVWKSPRPTVRVARRPDVNEGVLNQAVAVNGTLFNIYLIVAIYTMPTSVAARSKA